MQRTATTKSVVQKNGTLPQLQTNNVAVIRCEGEMGDMELANIEEELFRLNSKGLNQVVLDLSKATHVDYRGLGGLARSARSLRADGGDLKLVGLSNYVATIFRAAGFENTFETFDCVEEAKKAFLCTLYCLRH